MDISTGTIITLRVGGGQNSEMYWFVSSNTSPITRAKSVQFQRPNDFFSASIIENNYMEGLPDKKIFPWENPRARSLLWVRSSGLGPTWKTMEWTPYSVSTIQIQNRSLPSRLLGSIQRQESLQVVPNPYNYGCWGRKRKLSPYMQLRLWQCHLERKTCARVHHAWDLRDYSKKTSGTMHPVPRYSAPLSKISNRSTIPPFLRFSKPYKKWGSWMNPEKTFKPSATRWKKWPIGSVAQDPLLFTFPHWLTLTS